MAAPLAALGVLSAAGFVLNEMSKKKTQRTSRPEQRRETTKPEFKQRPLKQTEEESPKEINVIPEDPLENTFQVEENIEQDDILNPGITDEEPENDLSGIFQTSNAPTRMMLPNSTGRNGAPPEPGLMGPIHIPKQEIQNAQPRPQIPTYMNAPRRPIADEIYSSMKKSYHDGQAPIMANSGLQRRLESRTRYNPTVPSDRQPLENTGPAGAPARNIARAVGEMNIRDTAKRTPVSGNMRQTQGITGPYVPPQSTLPKNENIHHSRTGGPGGFEKPPVKPHYRQSIERNEGGRPNAPGMTQEGIRAKVINQDRVSNTVGERAHAVNTGMQYAPVRPDGWDREHGPNTEFGPPSNRTYGAQGARVQNTGQTLRRMGNSWQPVANKAPAQGGRNVYLTPGSTRETLNTHVVKGGIAGGPTDYAQVTTGRRSSGGITGQGWYAVGERQPGIMNVSRKVENTRQYVRQKTGMSLDGPRTSVQTRTEKTSKENSYVSGKRGYDAVDGRDFMEFSEKEEIDSERPIIGAYGDGNVAKQSKAEITRNPRSKTVHMPVF